MIANDNPIYSMELEYENHGLEDAVGLRLNFTNLSPYITRVAIRRGVSERVSEAGKESEGKG